MKAPNVVYILTDQWRAQAFGYAGDANVQTPHIDELASRSLNFSNAISVAPVCTPHRAALLTGRYPSTTGMFMNDLYLPASERCMAEFFADAGYDTAYIGKWHLDGHGRATYIPRERRQGFDYWKVLECTHDYNDSIFYAGEDQTPQRWDGYDAYPQTDDAIAYLRDHADSDTPFLLFLAYGGPHFPHDNAPPELQDLYPEESIRLRRNVPPELADAARAELQGYYAHCTAIDSCVGRLHAAIEDLGIEEETIFVFTSDHGDMHGSQGKRSWRKQVPWDESVCVPFLLRFPPVTGAGREEATTLNTPDILPTLLSLCGIPLPDSLEGDDMADVVRGDHADPDRFGLFMMVARFGADDFRAYRGVRNGRHTYVADSEGPWLLYDNVADPFQMTNLIDDPENQSTRDALERALRRLLSEIDDDFPDEAEALRRWGYSVGERGEIPYTGEFEVQSPAR